MSVISSSRGRCSHCLRDWTTDPSGVPNPLRLSAVRLDFVITQTVFPVHHVVRCFLLICRPEGQSIAVSDAEVSTTVTIYDAEALPPNCIPPVRPLVMLSSSLAYGIRPLKLNKARAPPTVPWFPHSHDHGHIRNHNHSRIHNHIRNHRRLRC